MGRPFEPHDCHASKCIRHSRPDHSMHRDSLAINENDAIHMHMIFYIQPILNDYCLIQLGFPCTWYIVTSSTLQAWLHTSRTVSRYWKANSSWVSCNWPCKHQITSLYHCNHEQDFFVLKNQFGVLSNISYHIDRTHSSNGFSVSSA